MKIKILLCMICIVSGLSAQYVTLEGKQFKLNGANFYPKVLNYAIHLVWNDNVQAYDIARNRQYGPWVTTSPPVGYPNQVYPCFPPYSLTNVCHQAIQDDFNYIAGMGFNCLRLTLSLSYNDVTHQLYYHTVDVSNINGYDININPATPNDPGMAIVIPLIQQILNLADNTVNSVTGIPQPLKVIYIIATTRSNYDSYKIQAINNFLSALAPNLNNYPALLAYDLFNEPSDADFTPGRTKAEACTIVNDWCSAINPVNSINHHALITIGLLTIGEVLKYDPSILNVDFISVHTYPNWQPWEDRTDPAMQQLGLDRVYNDLFWFNRNSAVPWIIGETSLGATNNPNFSVSGGLDGTYADEANFSEKIQDAICNCGGSGFSWWDFKDRTFYSVATNDDTFLGLLEEGGGANPSSSLEKPAVDKIRNFTKPNPPAPCPVSYSPTYNINKVYYNPFQHPANPLLTIKGKIIDQDGNAIRDAYVAGRTNLGKDVQMTFQYDFHFSYSDNSGNFELIPYKSNPNLTDGGNIVAMDISASGAERRAFGLLYHIAFDPMPPPNDPSVQIVLNKVNFAFDGNIHDITVPTSQTRNFKGYNTLTTSNIIIEPGAISELVARNEVHLTSGFDAASGSDVHIYNASTFSDCDDFIPYLMQYKNGVFSNKSYDDDKNSIELSFKTLFNNFLVVSPNPGSGRFSISLNNKTIENINSICVNNTIGEKIFFQKINQAFIVLDLSNEPKGVYFIKAETNLGYYFQKLILQ